MPFVDRNGARIHWSSLGKGEPVVLIMGLGCSSAMWFRVAPQLAKRHRVILLDNRGSGQTQVQHYVVHRVAHMAADVVAVIAAAGEGSAHVVGFSMGGMIAQQLAIDFPQRVRSLALLCTHSGGPWAIQAEPHVRRLLFGKAKMDAQEGLDALRPHTYARETSDALFDEDALVRLANLPSARDYLAQLVALIGWSAWLELPRFQCPTLVMHGLQDELIPPANARRTADRIPGARLIEMPDASHWLMTDQNAKVLAALREHIDRHT
jgi:pimeloyl-ACP methyl ester carboxylesterase